MRIKTENGEVNVTEFQEMQAWREQGYVIFSGNGWNASSYSLN